MDVFVAICLDGDGEDTILAIHSTLSKLEKVLYDITGEGFECVIYKTEYNPEKGLYLDLNNRFPFKRKRIKTFRHE